MAKLPLRTFGARRLVARLQSVLAPRLGQLADRQVQIEVRSEIDLVLQETFPGGGGPRVHLRFTPLATEIDFLDSKGLLLDAAQLDALFE